MVRSLQQDKDCSFDVRYHYEWVGQEKRAADERVDRQREMCTCKHWSMSGKRCWHLYAHAATRRASDIRTYEARVASYGAALGTRQPLNDDIDNPAQDFDEWDFEQWHAFPAESLIDDTAMDEAWEFSSVGTTPVDITRTTTNPPLPVSQSLAGRPARTEPIRTLLPRKKARQPRDLEPAISEGWPLGIVNTGIDCYILSLFQVLWSSISWQTVVKQWDSRKATLLQSQLAFVNLAQAVLLEKPVALDNIRQQVVQELCRSDRNPSKCCTLTALTSRADFGRLRLDAN